MDGDQEEGEQADMGPISRDEPEPVIRFKITKYMVIHYSQDPVEPVKVILYSDSPYTATAHFYKPEYNLRPNYKSPNDNIEFYYYIYDLRIFLDLLRNEKPVYFRYYPNYGTAYISTRREPVGEEETTNAGE